jgi:hypothetical protein
VSTPVQDSKALETTITSANGQSSQTLQTEQNQARTDVEKLLLASQTIWTKYGVSGGCLVLGGAVALIAVPATMVHVPGWKPTDLIVFMSFAVLLIVIGVIANLISRSLDTRAAAERVQLFAITKDGITRLHEADVEALASAYQKATDAGSQKPTVFPN